MMQVYLKMLVIVLCSISPTLQIVLCSISPHTSDSNDENAFNKVLECGYVMTTLHNFINAKMNIELLPNIKYRISIDYGKVEIAKSISSTTCDLFGPTVNI